jgi:phage terminase small subunit
MEVKSGEENKSQKPLNTRQERFVMEYIKSGNASLSAELAGYSKASSNDKGCLLLKDPRISRQIQAYKDNSKKEMLKDRQTFLAEVSNLKQLCLDSKRIGDLVKLLNLEAEVLNLKKPDNQQQINIFSAMDSAKAFLNAQEGGEEVKTREDIAPAEIVEPCPILATENAMHTQGEDTLVEPVNDIHI